MKSDMPIPLVGMRVQGAEKFHGYHPEYVCSNILRFVIGRAPGSEFFGKSLGDTTELKLIIKCFSRALDRSE
jgi:hypothetical protein